MIKVFKCICLFLVLCNLNSQAAVRCALRYTNQEVIGTDFYFDVFVQRLEDAIYLGSSDIYLDYNVSNFTSPSFTLITKGESLTNYTIATTIDANQRLVISINQPAIHDLNDLNNLTSFVESDGIGTLVGHFKITGIKVPNLLAGLQFYMLKTRGTDLYCLNTSEPFDAYRIGEYELPQQRVLVNLKLFLEGSWSSGSQQMTSYLNSNGLVPKSSPYAQDRQSVSAIPSNITDWVLVELRKTPTGSPVAYRSALMQQNGLIVNINGTSEPVSILVPEGPYYVIVRHRNHLSVMSANAIYLYGEKSNLYDFTNSSQKFYGGANGAKQVGLNIWGMITGDINQDGGVYVEDYTDYKTHQGYEYYNRADLNMDSGVYGEDYTLYRKNQGAESEVP